MSTELWTNKAGNRRLNMALKGFTCPICGGSPMQIAANYGNENKESQVLSDIELFCYHRNEGCGYGSSAINIEDSPVDCVLDLIESYFPSKGDDGIKVEPDKEEPIIHSFDYKGKHYGECKTTFSCSIPEPGNSEYRITWYLVEFPRGKALLKHMENSSKQAEPDTWQLVDIDIDIEKEYIFGPEDETGVCTAIGEQPRPKEFLPSHSIEPVRYAIDAYKILYEVENLLRDLITTTFPANELEEMLKRVTFSGDGNKRESVYDRVSRRKETEQSKDLSRGSPLIEYIDWGEYIEVFRQKWDVLSRNKWPNNEEAKKGFIAKLEAAQLSRQKVAHMRSGITRDDIDLLRKAKETVQKLQA